MKRHIEVVAPKFLRFLSVFGSGSILAITFSPFIFAAQELDEVTLNHELIHVRQQQECSLVFTALILLLTPSIGLAVLPLVILTWLPITNPFYLLYVLFYMANLLACKFDGDLAYRLIPFELEAYNNEKDKKYLLRRSFMAWRVYI